MKTEPKFCAKCGIELTQYTNFSGFCTTCYAKTFEVDFSQGLRKANLVITFGENPRSYPDYAIVAETVYSNFPGAIMRLIVEENNPRFELYDETNLLLTIDSIGWIYSSGQRGGTWRSIKEGSLESISRLILRAFSEMDYAVYDPQNVFGHEFIKGRRIAARRINLPLRQCIKCKERGQVKKVYFGVLGSNLFKPEDYFYGGDKRKRFDPFYICLGCGWAK